MAFKFKKATPENWKDLKPHPLSCLVPYGQGISTVESAVYMRRVGYDETEPIVLFDGKILDGRHKHVMAQESDEVPVFVELVEGDLIDFITKKLHRQHLTDGQRAVFVAALKKARSEASECNHYTPKKTTLEEDAKEADVSRKTMADAVKVVEQASPAVQAAVASGQVAVNEAATAVRSVLCRRCRTRGAVKGCKECLEKRQAMEAPSLKPSTLRVHKPKAPPTELEKRLDWLAKIEDMMVGEGFTAPDTPLVQRVRNVIMELRKLRRSPAAKFPTLEDVRAYCKERKNKVNPEQWFDHYTSNGWKVGKNPMKDWQAAVRNWERPFDKKSDLFGSVKRFAEKG